MMSQQRSQSIVPIAASGDRGSLTEPIALDPPAYFAGSLVKRENDILAINSAAPRSDLERIRAGVDQEIAACTERVRALLSDASGLSEREVVAAGECVGAIKREARENVASLKAVSELLHARTESDPNGLEQAVSEQSRLLDEMVANLRERLSEQQGVTARVVTTATGIKKFVAIIGDISIGLRVLTLNARIEAARGGAQGSAFATIAESMQNLAGDVRAANDGIGELSAQLSSSACDAEAIDARMRTLMAEAEEERGASLERLLGAFRIAQQTSGSAARMGVERAEHMAELTNEVLSHLQFQDRMAQVLAEAANHLAHIRAIPNEFLARFETEEFDELARDIRLKFGSASIRLSGESELSASERDVESGVVLTF